MRCISGNIPGIRREDFPRPSRGKYKAFTCENTTRNHDGVHPTGFSYMKRLGVTHIQLMPAYDYGSVDESKESGS